METDLNGQQHEEAAYAIEVLSDPGSNLEKLEKEISFLKEMMLNQEGVGDEEEQEEDDDDVDDGDEKNDDDDYNDDDDDDDNDDDPESSHS